MEVLRPLSEAEEDQDNISVTSEDRQSRSGGTLSRNGSLRRRDSSWDKKWQEHVEKSVGDRDLPRSSIFARSPRQPGKVNRSLWELKAGEQGSNQEITGARSRPPPSPSSVPACSTPTRSWSPKVKPEKATTTGYGSSRACASPCMPHHGAALQDYSPQRVATPPYPNVKPEMVTTGYGSPSQNSNAEEDSAAVARANSRQASSPLPPPPPHSESKQTNFEDKPLPPPPSQNGHYHEQGHWKDEVKKKINFTISSRVLEYLAKNDKVAILNPFFWLILDVFSLILGTRPIITV